MAEFYLVRHGQASLGSNNYDQLSPMGVEQAEILGRHFAQRGITFDELFTGTQLRHQQTADGILKGIDLDLPTTRVDGLNEYDFESLTAAYIEQSAALKGKGEIDKKAAYQLLKPALLAWCQNQLQGELEENWDNFIARVNNALGTIQQSSSRRILVVSSGGPISAMTHQVLQAPTNMAIELNLQIRNTSFSQFFFNSENTRLASFNNLAHLEHPDHQHMITYA